MKHYGPKSDVPKVGESNGSNREQSVHDQGSEGLVMMSSIPSEPLMPTRLGSSMSGRGRFGVESMPYRGASTTPPLDSDCNQRLRTDDAIGGAEHTVIRLSEHSDAPMERIRQSCAGIANGASTVSERTSNSISSGVTMVTRPHGSMTDCELNDSIEQGPPTRSGGTFESDDIHTSADAGVDISTPDARRVDDVRPIVSNVSRSVPMNSVEQNVLDEYEGHRKS